MSKKGMKPEKIRKLFSDSVRKSKYYKAMLWVRERAAALYGAKTYIVGGTIRDFIVESRNMIEDIDLCLEGLPSDAALEKMLLSNGEIDRNMMGGFKWYPSHKISGRKEYFDIDIWRTEAGVTPGDRPTIENTLRRFDLNINSTAWDLDKNDFIDPLGGMKSLLYEDKKPIEILTEKVLNGNEGRLILRAIKYASRLDMDITRKSREWIKANEKYLFDLPDFRVNYVLRSIDCDKLRPEIVKRCRAWLSPPVGAKVINALYGAGSEIDRSFYSPLIREKLHQTIGYSLLKKIFQALPFKYRYYIFGGVVRDTLLGREVKANDMHIVVLGAGRDLGHMEKILRRFGKIRNNIMGALEFYPDGISFPFEIWRAEKSVEEGWQPTIENVLKGFDITANAVAYELHTGKIIDPVAGFRAIRERKIEIIPSGRNERHAARVILRAYKYAAKTKSRLSSSTLGWIKKHGASLKKISRKEKEEVLKGTESYLDRNKLAKKIAADTGIKVL